MTKMENAVVKPTNPPFYKRYVDDVFNKRKRNEPDVLLDKLNNCHPKIKFTIEISPEKFLDTKLINKDGVHTTEVFRKTTKQPVNWKSRIPKRYKRNTINGDLYRSSKISCNIAKEISIIKTKYLNADYPIKFIDNVINQFQSAQEEKNNNEEYLIPPFLFEEPKETIMIEIPYCEQNEITSKRFINRFQELTQNRYKVFIIWKTKKVRSLFNLKDPNPYPACKIYEGKCICGSTYIGETVRNVITRWSEHENPHKDSEPAKHLSKYPDHFFTWSILSSAPTNKSIRKNLEASFIGIKGPNLNDQNDFKKLQLFRNGVT